MSTIKERDSRVIWHPYTPMKIWPEAIAIASGEGVYLTDEEGNRYIDAISSWWVNLHGHSHPYIAEKMREQALRLEHCIFAGFTHEPAVLLAERLLEILPGRMSRIFYSDDGSTAVEVAIKMALQYWANKGKKKKKLVALQDAYHGDTFGAMAVSARSVFTEAFADLLFDVAFIPFPGRGAEEQSVAALEQLLQAGNVAALIVEPLVQGSAGMQMYSAEVLDRYFRLCRQHETLVIADEVMTGFGRTGKLFACDHISTPPDIVCLSKGLTGGTVPLGVTAATQDIFEAFLNDDRKKTLYHGHSLTANPVMCSAALASMDLLLTEQSGHDRQRIAEAHHKFAASIKDNPLVAEVRQTGTILAIEIKAEGYSYHHPLRDLLYQFFIDRKVIMRPLGNIIYLIPPYCMTNDQLEYIYGCIRELMGVVSTW